MTEPKTPLSDNPKLNSLEIPLKTHLENILSFIEKFVSSQDEIDLIESKLHDYESLNELVDIIIDIWSVFSQNISEKAFNSLNSEISTEEYRKLEESLQKHENQIRTHIAVEQQLRLCAETFQSKIEEISKEKDLISIEKDTAIEKFTKEIEKLKALLFDSERANVENTKKLEKYEKMIEENEKNLQDIRKRQGFSSDDRFSHKNDNFDVAYLESSPFKKVQATVKQVKNDNFGTLKEYLRVRNESKQKKTPKFEEIHFPKAFSELSSIYGGSLKNIFKSKKTLNNSNNNMNANNNYANNMHVINMNFPNKHQNLQAHYPLIPQNNANNTLNQGILNINLMNLTNSLIVNNHKINNVNGFNNHVNNNHKNKTRRSRSQGSFTKKPIKNSFIVGIPANTKKNS